MITYLVSGAEDIKPSHANIMRVGRRVRYDTEVSGDARKELRQSQRFVVIAHGSPDGTVVWERSDWAESRRWLYVGMKNPPRGSRVFLYSCCVGKKLPHFLKRCIAFGPVDVVPMPVDDDKEIVLGFLREAERLLRQNARFEPEKWTKHLGDYVNRLMDAEYQKPSLTPRSLILLVMLRKALGYPD